MAADDSWLYRFTTKGVYDLLRLPHLQLGMVMRVVVIDTDEDEVDDSTFDEPAADKDAPLPPNAAAVLDAGEPAPEKIVDAGQVAWADPTLDVDEDTWPRRFPLVGTPSLFSLSRTWSAYREVPGV